METQVNGPQGQWVLGQDWSPLGRMMRFWKPDHHPRFTKLICCPRTPVWEQENGETTKNVEVGFDVLAPGVWRISDPIFGENFARFMSQDHNLFMPLAQMQRIPFSEALELAYGLAYVGINPETFLNKFARDRKYDR